MILYYKTHLNSNQLGLGAYISDTDTIEGLEDFEITLKRHTKFKGIFPEITSKLKFFGGYRQYIEAAYGQFGINADVYIRIEISQDNVIFYVLYAGRLDFRNIEFSATYVEISLNASSAVADFLARTNTKVNLYDAPCFNELTYDRTARRIRYYNAPALVRFHEKEILGYTRYELLEDSPGSGTAFIRNGFNIDSGGLAVNAKAQVCNSLTDGCDSGSCQDHRNGNIGEPRTPGSNCDNSPDSFFYIFNSVPTFEVNDDLNISNQSYVAQTNAKQYSRNTGGVGDLCADILVTEEPFDYGLAYENQQSYIAEATCSCCSSNCAGYDINIETQFDVGYCLDVANGIVDWMCYTPELVLRWGTFENVLWTGTTSCPGSSMPPCGQDWDNNCDCTPGATSGSGSNLPCSNTADFSDIVVNTTFTIPACSISLGDRLRLYVRIKPAFRAGETVTGNADLQIFYSTTWKNFLLEIQSGDCIPSAPRLSATNVQSIFIHEAFSRLTEHYTNNELKVRSCYFGRPNSLAGGDDVNFQNGTCNYPYHPSSYPSTCLPNPAYDISSYQVTPGGCAAWMVITSGIQLRRFGTECFTTFDDLFNSMDAIWNIGVGYTDLEPDALRVENMEYFYQDTVILSLEIDEQESKFVRRPKTDIIYNSFQGGYKESKKDVLNTIDEFNTHREYNIPVKNAQKSLSKICIYIGAGYSIEWQRRQQNSTNAEYDAELFAVCVNRDIATMNTTEQGIDNVFGPTYWWAPQGIVSPATVYNWRISPYYNTLRNLSEITPSFWKNPNQTLYFSRGETNYRTGGSEPNGPSLPCDYDYDYQNYMVITHVENEDIDISSISNPRTRYLDAPEIVSFKYALTLNQVNNIRLNPYGMIKVNGESYWIQKVDFSLNDESKIELIRKI